MKRTYLTLNDFFNLTDAVLYNAEKIKPMNTITIDSRNVTLGSLFIAIKGEKFDGHNFVLQAIREGASAVVVNKKKLSSLPEIDVPVIAVKNTVLALGELASIWRSKLTTKIIGLTGSAGKTTTKEILYALLSKKFNVNKTQANNNNHIGVPITLFNTKNKHDFLVLEMGTNHFGEIKYTAEISKPDYALICNIGNSHLEFLKNKAGVYKEKSALFDTTVSNNGYIFINNDDAFLRKAHKNYSKRITFGILSKADVKGKIVRTTNQGKPIVQIKYKGRTSSFELPLYGVQNAQNFLAASAVAFKLGLSSGEIKEGLKLVKNADKRLCIKKIGSTYLVDDTYNANPESMSMSLQLLGVFKPVKKRIAVLGDMFELGEHSKKLHEGLHKQIIQNGIDEVYTIGAKMKYLNKMLKGANLISVHFSTRDELKDFLTNKSFSNSIVLVKGSRGMRMEEFVEHIRSKLNN